MLRTVLHEYLGRVEERDFDLPFLRLLPAMGFYDVHYTHGAVEYGKDFIAKRTEDGVVLQYSFQSKKGDVTQRIWRNDIQGQVMESVLVPLSHPNFDKELPHQAVLVLTGDLRHQAGLAVQEMNETLKRTYGKRPIVYWVQNNLVDFIIEYGLQGIHGTTPTDFVEYGAFFLNYGQALQGAISLSSIEQYSRQWKNLWTAPDRRLLWCVIEAEVLANECLKAGRIFEAIHVHLARIRALCVATYEATDARLVGLFQDALSRLSELCRLYVGQVRVEWDNEKDLMRTSIPSIYIATYPVQCARLMTAAALAYFTSGNDNDKAQIALFLDEFTRIEMGCCHPISDQYAVSLVAAALALLASGRSDSVARMLLHATVWLCDRYEKGAGLADLAADEVTEINILLGYPFDFIEVPDRHDSFVAAALCDLAAFLGNGQLYSDILNDLQACEILPSYFQPLDTIGSCDIEGEDVVQYPTVSYVEPLSDFAEFRFANHIVAEPVTFRFVDEFGPTAIVALMTLLRDRYFPTIWPKLLPNHRPQSQETRPSKPFQVEK